MLVDQKQRLEVFFYLILGIICFHFGKFKERSWRNYENGSGSMCKYQGKTEKKGSLDRRFDENV